MRKNTQNLILLNCFFVASLIIVNVVASKLVNICGFIVPAAMVVYPVTFLCTDVIGEIWGKAEANKTVRNGIIMQLFSLGMIYMAIALPPAPYAVEFQEVFSATLGNSARIVLASLAAYVAAQFNDVFVFHKLKALSGGKHKWLRNNASTITSQLIDTVIFVTVGFAGAVPDIGWMIVSQFILKIIIALCDTPFFYFMTRERKGK